MISPEKLEELKNASEIAMEAHEVARVYRQVVPQPMELLPLLRPMKFKRLVGKEHEIRRVKMDCAEVATMRHSALFGVKAVRVNFGKKVTFHELLGPKGKNGEGDDLGRGVLTSDRPVEIYSQYIAFHKMRGHVLIGGLGLGMAAEMILNLPEVSGITVVEINKNLIELVQAQIDERVEVVHDDLFEYLKVQARLRSKYRMPFDSAYFDIWYGTGESTWASTSALGASTRCVGNWYRRSFRERELRKSSRSGSRIAYSSKGRRRFSVAPRLGTASTRKISLN
jgi:hypothetical protein